MTTSSIDFGSHRKPKKKIMVSHGMETHRPCLPCSDVSVEFGRYLEREELLNELTAYYQGILADRGIKSPTWIGKNELQNWIDGKRDNIL